MTLISIVWTTVPLADPRLSKTECRTCAIHHRRRAHWRWGGKTTASHGMHHYRPSRRGRRCLSFCLAILAILPNTVCFSLGSRHVQTPSAQASKDEKQSPHRQAWLPRLRPFFTSSEPGTGMWRALTSHCHDSPPPEKVPGQLRTASGSFSSHSHAYRPQRFKMARVYRA